MQVFRQSDMGLHHPGDNIWKAFSLGLTPSKRFSPRQLVGAENYQGKFLKVSVWDSKIQAYNSYLADDLLPENLHAFWLRSDVPANIILPEGITRADSWPWSCDLDSGWNLIASPSRDTCF